MVFKKSGRLSGTTRVPGDKSISHRSAIAGALCNGSCRITGFSPAKDCRSTLQALKQLGVRVEKSDDEVVVEGVGANGFHGKDIHVFAGNSGTTMRLLCGALAPWPVDVVLKGDKSLQSRPMNRVIEPLIMMGADIEALGDDGRPPLHLRGGRLHGIDYSPAVASAQVKSCVLLAGLHSSGTTTVHEITGTRDHTERMLEYMEIGIKRSGLSISVQPGVPEAKEIPVPGDISSAAFIAAAAIICPGSDLKVENTGLNPTRTGFIRILEKMGADIECILKGGPNWEPSGVLRARSSGLKAVSLSGEDVADAIDEITLIALLATQAEGTTTISGAGELRSKESDRVRITCDGLKAMGADITELEDGMIINGPCRLSGTTVSCGSDHRMAMMFALAGLVADGDTRVSGWEWTEISFPGFGRVLGDLGARLSSK